MCALFLRMNDWFQNKITTYSWWCPGSQQRHARLRWKLLHLIEIAMGFVTRGPIGNMSALVQIMAWRCSGNTPLLKLCMHISPTHTCVTQPQWVKALCFINTVSSLSVSQQNWKCLLSVLICGCNKDYFKKLCFVFRYPWAYSIKAARCLCMIPAVKNVFVTKAAGANRLDIVLRCFLFFSFDTSISWVMILEYSLTSPWQCVYFD